MTTLENILYELRWNGVSYLIAIGIVTIFLLGGYVTFLQAKTKIRCVVAGYPSSDWNLAAGGVCFKLENGNTIMVKVTDLPK